VLPEIYDRTWTASREFFRAANPSFAEIGDALVGRVAASLAPLREPATLLHGDAHFENLALIQENDGRRGVLFHDWAGVCRGQASFDVAVFLVMSFPVDVRRRVEEACVALHAEAVRGDGIQDPADPWACYRRGVLAWAVRLVLFARSFPHEDPIARSALRMVAERCTTAAVDLEVGELIR
jgi:aminoglycoside/choline kinase family phosphotransferase